jgi:hypothetical protein
VEPLPPSYDRRGRFAGLTVALVVLLALVAISSRSGFGGSGDATPNPTYVSWAMSVFFVVFVLMIPLAIYSYVVRTKEMSTVGRTQGKRFWRMMAALVILGIAVYVRHWIKVHGFFGHSGLFHHDSKLTDTGKLKAQHGRHVAAQPHFEYPVLWAAIAIGVLVLVAWLVYRASREPVIRPALAFEDNPFAEAISDAIDDLEREPDPRRAVIAAYARMERELGRQGLPRRPSETPLEYMRRALHEQTARSASVESLTALFERAKFSRHEITPAMKQEAIDALVDIREGITG